jgi:hypothetical protein
MLVSRLDLDMTAWRRLVKSERLNFGGARFGGNPRETLLWVGFCGCKGITFW